MRSESRICRVGVLVLTALISVNFSCSDDQSWDKPKRVVDGYNPPPFAFVEELEGGERVVAWSGSLAQVKNLTFSALETFGSQVDVLVKQTIEDGPAGKWSRWTGSSTRGRVAQAIKKRAIVVFQDSGMQFLVRDAVTRDYIVVDEYGIVYLYGDAQRYLSICERSGFHGRQEALLSDGPSWAIRPPQWDYQTEFLIKELDLTPVPSDED